MTSPRAHTRYAVPDAGRAVAMTSGCGSGPPCGSSCRAAAGTVGTPSRSLNASLRRSSSAQALSFVPAHPNAPKQWGPLRQVGAPTPPPPSARQAASRRKPAPPQPPQPQQPQQPQPQQQPQPPQQRVALFGGGIELAHVRAGQPEWGAAALNALSGGAADAGGSVYGSEYRGAPQSLRTQALQPNAQRPNAQSSLPRRNPKQAPTPSRRHAVQ